MRQDLVRLVYSSNSHIDLLDFGTEIDSILGTCFERNQNAGVTGALLFWKGKFCQLLEGPESSVRETYGRIRADRRHSGCSVIEFNNTQARAFPAYPMFMVDVDLERVDEYELTAIITAGETDLVVAPGDRLVSMMANLVSSEHFHVPLDRNRLAGPVKWSDIRSLFASRQSYVAEEHAGCCDASTRENCTAEQKQRSVELALLFNRIFSDFWVNSVETEEEAYRQIAGWIELRLRQLGQCPIVFVDGIKSERCREHAMHFLFDDRGVVEQDELSAQDIHSRKFCELSA